MFFFVKNVNTPILICLASLLLYQVNLFKKTNFSKKSLFFFYSQPVFIPILPNLTSYSSSKTRI